MKLYFRWGSEPFGQTGVRPCEDDAPKQVVERRLRELGAAAPTRGQYLVFTDYSAYLYDLKVEKAPVVPVLA